MDVAQTVEAAMPALLAVAGPVLAGAGEAVTRTSADLGRRLLERLFGARSGEVVPASSASLSPEAHELVREAVRQALLADPALLGRLEALMRGGNVFNVGQGMAVGTNHGQVTLNFSQGT
ncbi:hypothetical protein ACIA8O_11055 [Kitasatospora sp. NPDC051853]|uniref:hypothetical protein n=1 Tax=Kitasatospora sp. NPDC051853 TaxID=3364058 RepID=UPI003798CF25